MVHTAEMYILLDLLELKAFEKYYGKEARFISKEDCEIKGIKSYAVAYNYGQWRLFLKLDFPEMFNRGNLRPCDFLKAEEEIQKHFYEILSAKKQLILTRVDYKLDVIVSDTRERKLIFKLFQKILRQVAFLRRDNDYQTGVVLKSGSKQVQGYGKIEERDCKRIACREWEENIIRLECQILNRHLNTNLYTHGVAKSFENYFTWNQYFKYMAKVLEPIFYRGDYFKLYYAEKIINQNPNLNGRTKEKLRDFLVFVSENNLQKAKDKYGKYQFRKLISILSENGINPILIPKNYSFKFANRTKKYISNPFKAIDEIKILLINIL